MATPRQRRKARSGNHSGPSARSKKAAVKKLKKPAPTIKGPEVLKEKWDRNKTVRQNYAALGLVASMQIHQSGGYAKDDPYNRAKQQEEEAESNEGASDAEMEGEPSAAAASSSKPKKGMARIVRDENGNVIDIVEAEASDDDAPEAPAAAALHKAKRVKGKGKKKDESAVTTPWGAPLNDSDDEELESGSKQPLSKEERAARDRALHLPVAADAGASDPKAPANELHAQLDKLAEEKNKPVPRYTSLIEEDWLRNLVAKYGDDYEAASRDKRLNLWQKTAGEIKRAVRKAGGLQALTA